MPFAPFRSTRRATPRVALAVGLLCLAGCGQTPAPTAADESEARKTLDQALAAWQQGQTIEALKQASPSIVVSDPNWQQGDALTKYEVVGAGKPSGAEREFTVRLWLAPPKANPKAKEKKTEVAYKVGTDPILTVFRALF
ncbi:MAG: hypothetical protein U0790_21450 [Isosphaeraceae bacterium]